jgi:hypothetical protein
MSRAVRSDLQIPQHDPPEHEHIAILQIRLRDATAIDKSAIGGAVVEDAGARAAVDEDCVAPGDRILIEAQVGGETTTYVINSRSSVPWTSK